MSASLCLWIIVKGEAVRSRFSFFNLRNDRRVHAALGDELGALPVHLDKQALARFVDKGDRAEHDAYMTVRGGDAVPAFLHLVDPWPGELSLQVQDCAGGGYAGSDFQHARLIPDYFQMNNRFFPVVVGLDERIAPAKFIVRMLQPRGPLHFRICVGDHLRSLHNELHRRRGRNTRSITVVVKAGSIPCVPIRAINMTVVNIESS
jgi:hypothetical protein